MKKQKPFRIVAETPVTKSIDQLSVEYYINFYNIMTCIYGVRRWWFSLRSVQWEDTSSSLHSAPKWQPVIQTGSTMAECHMWVRGKTDFPWTVACDLAGQRIEGVSLSTFTSLFFFDTAVIQKSDFIEFINILIRSYFQILKIFRSTGR